MKYSFLLPYFNRAVQFRETLKTFRTFYGARNDWELIVVVDAKSPDIPDISGFRALVLTQKVPTSNPCQSYNKAALAAMGDIFIVTNPEVRHDTDILAGLDAIFAVNSNAYVVCACEALDRKGRHFMWYQHSQRRNCCYHFCTAITRPNWFHVGGFDERYADGIAYDDNDFRESVRAAGLDFVMRDDLKTTHLWHPKPHLELPNKSELEARNKAIYEAKWGLTE